MANPFEKRATEYSRDSETFFSLVTPEPLRTFLEGPATQGLLWDRLVLITGTPGSGKTTMATLLQFHFVDALRRNRWQSGYRDLVSALRACSAIDDDMRPTVAGVRLPLESEYRDFWQLPYSAATRTRLVLTLLQARAMMGWLRNITTTELRGIEDVHVVPKAGADAAVASMGGSDAAAILDRAAAVEQAIYRIGAALVPPDTENDFPDEAKGAYRPFDAVEAFEIPDDAGAIRLQPLLMLDDAHTLHPEQLVEVNRDLARRELLIARWVLTRVDVLTPTEALLSGVRGALGSGQAGPQLGRDVTVIAMQKGEDRSRQRRAFRKMARDMANRYLRQMPEFSRRGHESFADLLETAPQHLSANAMRDLERQIAAAARKLGISSNRTKEFEEAIQTYVRGATSPDVGRDVQCAMLPVMMHRYAKRVPQATLFDQPVDYNPKKPVKADASVAQAARVHLHHLHGRPYYFGIDAVCDGASENAEQFLHLAAKLVDRAETQLLRNRTPALDAGIQQKTLRSAAARILEKYDYPYAREAQVLTDALAAQCLERTLEPNASLGAGANAVGVPQEEFEQLPELFPRLASVIQFAVAYNVVTLAQDYGQGKKMWCLLELGGCVCIKHGLTLQRGGFLEQTVAELDALLPPEDE